MTENKRCDYMILVLDGGLNGLICEWVASLSWFKCLMTVNWCWIYCFADENYKGLYIFWNATKQKVYDYETK